jgi:hypothetical protein
MDRSTKFGSEVSIAAQEIKEVRTVSDLKDFRKTQYQVAVHPLYFAAVDARKRCFQRKVCRSVSILTDLSSSGLSTGGSERYLSLNFRDLRDLPLNIPRFLPEYMFKPSL